MLSWQRLLGTVSQGQSDGDLSKLIKKKSKASAWSHGSRPGSAQNSPIGT